MSGGCSSNDPRSWAMLGALLEECPEVMGDVGWSSRGTTRGDRRCRVVFSKNAPRSWAMSGGSSSNDPRSWATSGRLLEGSAKVVGTLGETIEGSAEGVGRPRGLLGGADRAAGPYQGAWRASSLARSRRTKRSRGAWCGREMAPAKPTGASPGPRPSEGRGRTHHGLGLPVRDAIVWYR